MRAVCLTCLSVLLAVAAVHGKVYKWVDNKGKVHFTDNLEAVPSEYRSTVEEKASTPPSPPTPPTQPGPDPVSYTVPLHKQGNALFADVVFNNAVTVRMLVDTGATDTMISPKVAQQLRLDLHTADVVPVSTANGVTLIRVTQVPAMSVGGATAHNVDVSVHDAGPVDGLLGMSFLDNFQVSISVTEGAMVLTTSAPARPGDMPSLNRPESWWRSRFRFYRQAIADTETYLKEKPLTPELKTQLEKSRQFFQQKLDALDNKARLAEIPRQWRY